MDVFWDFLQVGLVGNFAWGNLVMLAIGCLFIYLGIAKDYEPLLLVPIAIPLLLFQADLKKIPENIHDVS